MYLDYIRYFFKSVGKHHLHSPFVFDFYTKVYSASSAKSLNQNIEKLRQVVLKNKNSIEVIDLGAGSKVSTKKHRKIGDILKKSALSSQKASFLQRIIEFYNYKNVLELGTSLGFTTAYLANSNNVPNTVTLEGCPNTLEIAQQNLKNLRLENVTYIQGNIDDTLIKALESMPKVDFVFFDANHSYEATVNYFDICLNKKTDYSCFVFDDIYWSEGMKKAWKKIANNQEVTISIDTFYFGILFFRKGIFKQHFIIK